MMFQLCVLWAVVTVTPPSHLHATCSVAKSDGGVSIVQLFAQEAWMPLEGTRWWVGVDGPCSRLDSYGFESNAGPIYRSPQGDQVIVFRTFRNTVDDGLCFELVTGQVTEVRGPPSKFEQDGWKRLHWQEVEEDN